MRRFSPLCLLVLAACSGSSDGSQGGAPEAPAGEPANVPDCGPGTRPVAGDATTCAAVGTTSVPPGFVADGAWGFRPILPETVCTGATIAVLGKNACEPIDDCNAAFPPAATAVAVRASGEPFADRPGVKVVKTIDEALVGLAIGAVVAVDEGDYALPAEIDAGVRFVGRCAEKTVLRGKDFGAKFKHDLAVDFQSLQLTAPKPALLVDSGAIVRLDRVWIHSDGDTASVVGNGAQLFAKRTLWDGPSQAANPNAATTALQGVYDAKITIDGSEMRHWQLAIFAQSVGTEITITNSALHHQVALDAAPEGLSTIGAFLGAKITVDRSHVESTPGRIAMIGAERLDGQADATSPGDPGASVTFTNGTLVQTGERREAGSGIDTLHEAKLVLDNVSMHHDSYVGISSNENASVTVKRSVIRAEPSATNARMALAGTSHGTFTVDATALVGSSQFAVLLDGGSSATITSSLVTGNKEVGIADFTQFMGAAQAISVNKRGKVAIDDTAFVANEGSAIFVQEGVAQLGKSVLAKTTASHFGPFTAAITAVDATLTVRDSALARNDRAFALRRGRALLRDSAVVDHREALRLEGVELVETSDAQDDPIDAEIVAARTTFLRNAVLVTPKALNDE